MAASTRPNRLADDVEIRERLVRVETTTSEIPAIRTRIHDLAQSVHILVGNSEEAAEQRGDMAKKIDRLAEEATASALASARVQTELATTFAAHTGQCKVDKDEIKKAIAEKDVVQERRHIENRDALEKNRTALERLEKRVAMFAGGAVIIAWLLARATELAAHLLR